jgi:hypothetical protein
MEAKKRGEIMSIKSKFYFSHRGTAARQGRVTVMISALLLFWISPTSMWAQNSGANQEGIGIGQGEKKLRIGVLSINTPTGIRHWKGIKEAVSKHEFYKYVDLQSYHYADKNDGFELLQRLILDEKADIILGPTESDIFVRAVDLEEELSDKKVPVISGLVTVRIGNRKDGWFFRINVDVTRRVQIIYDFLNKHWISTMGVLYADTEFGRRAERAFKNELKAGNQEEGYMSLLYDNPPNPRKQLRSIIKNRPEAVGIFCEREEIQQIWKQLQAMNKSGTPYNPLLFTILDVRRISHQIDDIYFVTLTGSSEIPDTDNFIIEDEVKCLGYDLGVLVFKVLEDMNRDNQLFTQPFNEDKRLEFRKQLCTLLNRSTRLDETKTKMIFTNFENTTIPRIFHLKDQKFKPIDIVEHIGWIEKFVHKVDLLFGIYGYWIYISLFIIFIVAFSISRMELKRLFPHKHVKIYKTKAFYYYVIGHFLIVLLLYIVLSESGSIKYNDIFMVFIISLTPSAFLRTTFFETRYGHTIGLEGFYKNLMSKVENRIMSERYKSLEAITNVIAYSNSENSIRESLYRIYNNHPSPTQRSKLIQKMEEDMAKTIDYLERRRVGARLLLRQLDKNQLKAEGFVPQTWDYEHPFDPRLIIRKAARHWAHSVEKTKKIDKLLKEQLKNLKKRNEKRYEELIGFMKKELKEILSKEAVIVVKLRILLVMVGFNIKWFIDEGLLDPNDLKNEEEEAENNRKKSRWYLFFKRKTRQTRESPL